MADMKTHPGFMPIFSRPQQKVEAPKETKVEEKKDSDGGEKGKG